MISQCRDMRTPPAKPERPPASPMGAGGLSSRAASSSDSCRWRVVFTHHVAAIAGQLVVPHPALLSSGCVAHESPRTTVPGDVAKVIGALVVHPLPRLNAAIAGATTQGHSIGWEVDPATVVLVRVTEAARHGARSPHPGTLWFWSGRIGACRYSHGYCRRGRRQHRPDHTCGGPRHSRRPLSTYIFVESQVPRPTRLLGSDRCVAVTTLGSAAFLPLSFRLPSSPTVA